MVQAIGYVRRSTNRQEDSLEQQREKLHSFAAARGWAVVVDGYIAGAAALMALAWEPALADFLIWSHRSAEPGAARMLGKLGIEPVLDLGLRLGEGTGAALAVPILRSACAVMREMATFSSAGVSGKA